LQGKGNQNGRITCINYGQLTSVALDPSRKSAGSIYAGRQNLSVGVSGATSDAVLPEPQHFQASAGDRNGLFCTRTLFEKACALIPRGNIGLAYTYNEPLIRL
jgi:pyruvate formate lyase activating enzyme